MSYSKARAIKEKIQLYECILTKKDRILINWLPGSFARKGLPVLGVEKDGSLSSGWIISKVTGRTRITANSPIEEPK